MSSSLVIELTSAKLQNISICCAGLILRITRVNPNTLSVKAGLKDLDTDDGEQEPEETDEERDIDK